MSIRKMIQEVEDAIKNSDRDGGACALINLANETGNECYVEDIIHTDEMDEFVQARMESGWQSVLCCLAKINYLNDEYYVIDGYANLRELEISDLSCALADMKTMLEEQIQEEIDSEEDDELVLDGFDN